jgi:hypothetical protein
VLLFSNGLIELLDALLVIVIVQLLFLMTFESLFFIHYQQQTRATVLKENLHDN